MWHWNNDPNDGKYLWLNEKHLEYEIGYSCLTFVTNKYHKNYKKCRHELNENSKKAKTKKFHTQWFRLFSQSNENRQSKWTQKKIKL